MEKNVYICSKQRALTAVLFNEKVHKNSCVDNVLFAVDRIMHTAKTAIADLPLQTLLCCEIMLQLK